MLLGGYARLWQLSQGGRPRQGPALAALSWLCPVLAALMARASPDLCHWLMSLSPKAEPEGSPGWPHDAATSLARH